LTQGEGTLSEEHRDSNKEARERMAKADDGHLEWTKEVSRSLARDFESGMFDDVRAEIKPGQPWHGMNVDHAFKFAGASPDYYQDYDLQTFFVHTTNIDFDFSPGSAETPALRALVDRDPNRIRHVLGLSLMRMHRIMDGFARDKAGEDKSSATLKGDVLEVDALTGLGMTLVEVFGSGQIEAKPA
jgi:hypothetical protein